MGRIPVRHGVDVTLVLHLYGARLSSPRSGMRIFPWSDHVDPLVVDSNRAKASHDVL